MNIRNVFRDLVLVISLLIVARCSSPNSAGNGSQTSNAAIAGVLYLSNNEKAVGVTVTIRPRNTLADTEGQLQKRAGDTVTVLTDGSGRFVVDSIDTGLYVVEATTGNDAVFIDSVFVQKIDSTVELPPDTLKPMGAVKGTVRLSQGGNFGDVYVLVFGVDRFATVDSVGNFRFEHLAEAAYDLRVISSLGEYGSFDMSAVLVVTADTTVLDTIDLPFEGIPTPTGVSLLYASLQQIVTLTWIRNLERDVKGYNVYRKHSDSAFVKINAALITAMTFSDSTAIQDQSYEYKIAAVDDADNEGEKSAGVSVTVVAAFKFVTSLGSVGSNDGQFNEPGEMATDSMGNVYILDPFNTQGKIHKYTNAGVLVKTWIAGAFDELRDIEIARDTLYVLDRKNRRIKIFNTDGDSLLIWTFPSSSDPMNFSINNRSAFIIDKQNNRILKYSLVGDSLSTLSNFAGITFKTLKSITIDHNTGNLIVLDADSLGYIADSSGNLISQFKIEQKAVVNASSQWFLLKRGNLIYTAVEKHTIFVIDTNGRLLAQFGAFGSANGQFKYPVSVLESENKIYISDSQNSRIQIFE